MKKYTNEKKIKYVSGNFLEIKKAYDTTDHSLTIEKIEADEVREVVLD